MSADHERIWLQPRCDVCRGEDRTWCQDNVWSEGCDPPDCTNAPTEYVRADLVAPLRTESIGAQKEAMEANELLGAALLRNQTLRAENARLRGDAALMANAMLGRTPDRNVQDGEQCTATQAAIDEAVARCAALAAKEPGHE